MGRCEWVGVEGGSRFSVLRLRKNSSVQRSSPSYVVSRPPSMYNVSPFSTAVREC